MMTIEERLKYQQLKIDEFEKAFSLNQTSSVSVVALPLSTVPMQTVEVKNRVILTSTQNRFIRLISTKIGRRVMLPEFGSKLHELIDKSVNNEYKLKFRHYIADAFYNNNTSEAWDNELIPDEVKVKRITSDGTLEVDVKMKNGKVYSYGQES